jgi:hypothetical protein
MYRAHVVSDSARKEAVEDLLSAGTEWRSVKGKLLQREQELGGFENVYRMMNELAGGTERGRRGQSVSELLFGLGEGGGRQRPGFGGYHRSHFESGGAYWKDLFAGSGKVEDVTNLSQSMRVGVLPQFNEAAIKLEQAIAEVGVTTKAGDPIKVALGLKNITRRGEFQGGVMGAFRPTVPGIGKVDLPFYQIRFGSRNSGAILNIPQVAEVADPVTKAAMNIVSSDHTGLSYSTLPKFAVPKGPGKVGYDVVSSQEGLNMMLFGDRNRGVDGLATRLQKYHREGKSARDLVKDVSAQISSLMYRVHGSQDLTLAKLHSQSVVELSRFVKGERPSVEDITTFAKQMQASGYDVGPLASPEPMAKALHLGLRDVAKQADVFGEYFPVEKRFLQRVRPYELSVEAAAEMAARPIFGVLPRNLPITSTGKGVLAGHHMPMVVGAYSLKGAKHLSEEEAVISRSLGKMLETRTTKQVKVRIGEGFGVGTVGEELLEGEIIGTDYVTGESILAERRPGKVSQRILKAQKMGDVAFLEVETKYPAQDLSKIFGPKAVYHLAREEKGVAKELFHEMGVRKMSEKGILSALTKSGELEFVASASTLKGGMADVLKQMTEAAWIVGAQKVKGIPNVASISSERQRQLWNFVHREDIRKAGLRRLMKSGAEGMGAQGVGLKIIKEAHKWGFNAEELSLIGGLYFQNLKGDELRKVEASLAKAGLNQTEIQAMRNAEVVLGMPTMQIGEYGSQRWKRARMDPRALEEIWNQQWGEPGQLLVREMARRIQPEQSYLEADRALKSLLGSDADIPADLEKITSMRKAKQALGKQGFMLEYGGQELYVPGPEARRMGDYIPQPGDKPIPESLKSKYMGYFRSLEERKGVEEARTELVKEVEMEWQKAASLRGELVGSEAQMARRWLPRTPGEDISKMMTAEEFLTSKRAFTVGLGREPAERMFKDLMRSSLSAEEKAFVTAQREAFFRGEQVTGTLMRHPTHRPQSLMPARFQYVKGHPSGVLLPNFKVKSRGDKARVYDVSLAQGMKMDYDADRAYVSFISNEKVKVAVDEMMQSREYRQRFLQGVEASTELQALAKETAKRRGAASGEAKFIQGLERMVGVKVETGPVSHLVRKMRAAAAYGAGSKAEYETFSYLLAELEEAPISSKHGMNAAKVKELLDDFVYGTGTEIDQALRNVWDQIWDKQEMEYGGHLFRRDEQIAKLSEMVERSREEGHFAAFQATTERQSAAAKGRHLSEVNDKEVLKAIGLYESAQGSDLQTLAREMRMGSGSMVDASRVATSRAAQIGNAALQGFKKHWKYPAMAVAGAIGVSMLSSDDMAMPQNDPNVAVTRLGAQSSPAINVPSPMSNRLVTAGGGSMPAGYEGSMNLGVTSGGLQNLMSFGAETGAYVSVRDNRGAITPEYIDKVSRERYY